MKRLCKMPESNDRNAASKKATRNVMKNTKSPEKKSRISKVDLVLNTISEIELWQTESKEVWATMWNGKGYGNLSCPPITEPLVV
jgi:hypothetical protein